jgi:hypothetical protein
MLTARPRNPCAMLPKSVSSTPLCAIRSKHGSQREMPRHVQWCRCRCVATRTPWRYPGLRRMLGKGDPTPVPSLEGVRDFGRVTVYERSRPLGGFYMAEREGFEPSIPCRIHDFQSCALDRTMRPLRVNVHIIDHAHRPEQIAASLARQMAGVALALAASHAVG